MASRRSMREYAERHKRIMDRRYGPDPTISPDGEYMGHFSGNSSSKSSGKMTNPLGAIARVFGLIK